MSAEEYRLYAVHCFRMAESTIDEKNRLLLIDMAQSWLALARQADKNLTTDVVYETPPPRPEGSSPAIVQQQEQQQQMQAKNKK